MKVRLFLTWALGITMAVTDSARAWQLFLDGSVLPDNQWGYEEVGASGTSIVDFLDPVSGATNQAFRVTSDENYAVYFLYVGDDNPDELVAAARFRTVASSGTDSENVLMTTVGGDGDHCAAPSITIVTNHYKLWSYIDPGAESGEGGTEIMDLGPVVLGEFHTAYIDAHRDGHVRLWWDGSLVFDGEAPAVDPFYGFVEWGSGNWQYKASTTVDFDWVAYGNADDVPPQTVFIYKDGSNAIISWSTNLTCFVLQSTDDLSTTNWNDMTNEVSVTGSRFMTTDNTAGDKRFYRLRGTAISAPQLTLQSAPSFLTFGSNGMVTVNFAAGCTIGSLQIIRTNGLGQKVFEFPASIVQLNGSGGQVVLPLDVKDLAFGTNIFTLRLKDGSGGLSVPLTFGVGLGAETSGGSAPVLSSVTMPGSLRIPEQPGYKLNVKAGFNYSDADSDIERLRVRVTDPSGNVSGKEFSAEALGLIGSSGSFFGPLQLFTVDNEVGTYMFEFTLFDHNGNASGTVSKSFSLADFGGTAPLSVGGFDPETGDAGTVVYIDGTGFSDIPASNHVMLGGADVEVTDSGFYYLTVVVPTNALGGKFRVEVDDENSDQVAYSYDAFDIPGRIDLTPQSPEIPAGGHIQFEAALVARGNTMLEWRVNDIAGGNSTVGTISTSGLYQAPVAVPANSNVTVSVVQLFGSDVTAESTVTIKKPVFIPGRSTVFAGVGGDLRSFDGLAGVTIPPGVLASNVIISVAALYGTNIPPAASGEQLLGAADFGPNGLTFSSNVVITLPLLRYIQPGTVLPLRLYNPTNGMFIDEGIFATVTADGEHATAHVLHFSIYSIVVPLTIPLLPPPGISSVYPTNALEGMKQPILITGTNLAGDLVAQILLNGETNNDIHVSELCLATNQAGVLLQIQTIPDLTNGVSRDYTLRICQVGTTNYTEATFTVNGLDEFIVAPGQTLNLTNPPSVMYSEINIGLNATVSVNMGGLDVQSTGPVTVDGNLVAEGKNGSHGIAKSPGAGAPNPAHGGDGGHGRSDDGCDNTFNYDCAPADAFGKDGSLVLPELTFVRGQRGAPGGAADLGIVQIVQDLINCLSGSWKSCIQGVLDVIEFVDELNELDEGWTIGKYGENGVSCDALGIVDPGFGHGGGGGGGGGVIEIDFITDPDGGGGGGGGSGGRPVYIATASRMLINGLVSTKGGDGGDAAPSPDVASVPFFGDIHGSSGGGGGGGSGGRLKLIVGENYIVGDDGAVTASGGLAGRRALVSDDAGHTIWLRRSFNGRAPGGVEHITHPGHVNAVSTSVFAEPTTLVDVDTKVTFSSVVRARLLNGIVLRIIHNGVTNDILGIPEPNNDIYRVTPYRAQAILQPGLSTLEIPGMHGLLRKQIVYLPGGDTDGDGLSDADEAELGTDPNKSDTDGDGLTDLQEVLFGSDPLVADGDGDGLSDQEEQSLGTNPINPDTDGDGINDGTEVLLGSDPKDEDSVPESIPKNLLFACSGGNDGAILTVINPATGQFGLLHKPNFGLGFGLAFDSTANLFISKFAQLAQHDPISGDTTDVGDFGNDGGANIHLTSLAYNPSDDSLLGVEAGPAPNYYPTGQLVRVDIDSGVGTRLGSGTTNQIHALVFDPLGENLFAAVFGSDTSDRLVKLNPANGKVLQELGLIGFAPVFGLAWGTNGTLYGAQPTINGDTVMLTINTSTGAGTAFTNHVKRTVTALSSPAFARWSGIVSIKADGSETGSTYLYNAHLSITPDGKYVGFNNYSGGLVDLPTDNVNAYLRNLETGETKLVSVNRFGTASGAYDGTSFYSYITSVSDDGRYVAFYSGANDLVATPSLTELKDRAFVRDMWMGTTELLAWNYANTAEADLGSGPGDMSGDGRYIVFSSSGDSLTPLPWPGYITQLYVRDRQAQSNILVTVNPAGTARADDYSLASKISHDGRYVYFVSKAGNLVTNVVSGDNTQLYCRDLLNSVTTLISTNLMGEGGITLQILNTFSLAITPDGRYVAYMALAEDMSTTPDSNGDSDVYLHDLVTGENTLISTNLSGMAAGLGDYEISSQDSVVTISADGRYVAFHSRASDLTGETDDNDSLDVFLRDNLTGEIKLVSRAFSGGETASGGDSFNPVLSADGRRLFYLSYATNLIDFPDSNSFPDLFVYDIAAGTNALLSYNHSRTDTGYGVEGEGVPGGVTSVICNTNGTVVVFPSGQNDLTRLPDNNDDTDLFFRRLKP